jgi:hypothetical protein
MRAIARSKAYQLASRLSDDTQKDPRTFARMNVKGLSGEQLFDSLAVATGYRDPNPERARQPFNRGGPRSEFLTRFESNEKVTERQTSILQALTLMNGRFVNDQTSLDRSEALAAVVDYPFRTTEERVEAVFLKKKALADVFWTLLNTSEFILNH